MKIFLFLLYKGILTHLPSTESGSRFVMWIRWLRGRLGGALLDFCGKDVNIEKGADFGFGNGIKIGNHSGLGVNCKVRGPLVIGNDVMMGPDVIILTHHHGTKRTDIPMRLQTKDAPAPERVVIGNDVWIGTRVIIMPGVNIGDGSIIGAGAVVTKDVPEYTVVGGIPAKVIKQRK